MTVISGLPEARPLELEKVLPVVKEIVSYVKRVGDRAIIELTKKFDKIDIDAVVIDYEHLMMCCRELDPGIAKAIDKVYNFLWMLHEETLPNDLISDVNGVKLGYAWRPIEKVGVYVPGGRKSYPSSLMMSGIPAKVAGVKKLYVASPPLSSGCVNPAIAYISLKLGVDEVYRVGGAQAIAAMAYGTESVKKVDKIVGPGNIYVQVAKYLVQGEVSIDGVEGPTELIVIADDSADPVKIALDMMAQAEHGYETFIVLITSSKEVALKVTEILNQDKEHVYYINVVKDIEEAIDIVNKLAPEHLSLHISNPEEFLPRIFNVGAISLKQEPPALIDYIGPNHILPTNRWARFRGALSVYDFLKPVSMIIDSSSMDRELLRSIIMLAEYEGFTLHSKSIGVRFGRSSK